VTKTKLKVISGHGAKFRPKMDQAIIALMSKDSIGAAAQSIGIHANTLLRWMKELEFSKSYEQARLAAFSQSIARLQNATGSAVETLLEIMRDKKQPAALRVRTADMILSHAAGGDGLTARALHLQQLVKSRAKTRGETK
jgi:transposase-like protein